MSPIKTIIGRQIYDSRGIPTLEVDVHLESGIMGRAAVPSGASTGSHEALELRDHEKAFHGKGVTKALAAVNGPICEVLKGHDPYNQLNADQLLIDLDGTALKQNLGANGILGTSLALARAAAKNLKIPFYKYIGGPCSRLMPVPLINVLNGGMHADNHLDIQEFMIVPVSGKTFSENLQMAAEVFYTLKSLLKKNNLNTNVGDEGGFAPQIHSTLQALDLLTEAIQQAGYKPLEDLGIALDVAATELFHNNSYLFKGEDKTYNASQLIDFYSFLVKNYPILSIEDGMAEDDWEGWHHLTQELGHLVQLVGDDLFVTDINRLKRGIQEKSANAILIKPNQIGTLSETILTVQEAQKNGFQTILSHRSGETEDSIIADLAVGLGTGQIKTGSMARSDRMAKYNQLLRIEEDLKQSAYFEGTKTFFRRYHS